MQPVFQAKFIPALLPAFLMLTLQLMTLRSFVTHVRDLFKIITYDKNNPSQNATVIVKYSWGVFRALSQMIALSYGSMDAPTSES